MAGHDQKTEKPTQQRLQKARKEGRFASSRDFLSSVQFLLVFALALSGGEALFNTMKQVTASSIRAAFSRGDLNAISVVHIAYAEVWTILLPFFKRGAIVLGILLLVQLASTGFGLSTGQLMPTFSRLNFFSKLSQMPQQNAFSFLKAIILLPVVAMVLYAEISSKLPVMANLAMTDLNHGLATATEMVTALLWRLTLALFVLGVIDFARERQKFSTSLRMSKQDIKDEMKEAEGNPQMKMRIRRLQRDAARKSMLKAVPKATAVIVNPTHYAVALQYEMNAKAIPKVVAKGKNHLALMIRQKATENNVPIIENPPLAQSLYKAADVGQEIPPHLYRAVAEVLAYVYRTLHR